MKGAESYKEYFKLKNPGGKTQVISSLAHLNHWVLILEDGSDLSTCKAIKVNIPRFLQKYDFQTQTNEPDIYQKSNFTLTQQDFEHRALLELLDFVSNALSERSGDPKYYLYIFELGGRLITSLRQLTKETKMLIVSTKKHFRGLYLDTQQQLTQIHDSRAYAKSGFAINIANKRKARVANEWFKGNLIK